MRSLLCPHACRGLAFLRCASSLSLSPDGILANDTAAGVAAAAAAIRAKLPGAHLFVTLPFPRSNTTLPKKLPPPASPQRAEAVDELNVLVAAALEGAEGTTVVDCNDRFLARTHSRCASIAFS